LLKMGDKKSNKRTVFGLLIVGMLITGTVNTVITKLIFGLNEAIGCCGWTTKGVPNTLPHSFSHPWFSTWVMFLGEFLCIIPFMISRSSSVQSLGKSENPYTYIFAIPTCCDLTASTLGNIALLWIPASIWQMMRGAIIIFSAILSMIFLRRRLNLHHWLGILVVVMGLFLVGLSGVYNASNDTTRRDPSLVSLGITLVVCAQVLSAAQMVIEEKLLKDKNYEPINVVFMEGFWGLVIMSLVALPILYITPHAYPAVPPYDKLFDDGARDIYTENVLDAFSQMYNNPTFFFENLILLFSIAFYNFFGLALTTYLSAVHRTLIDACRTISVWGVQLIIYYLGLKSVGEEFTNFSFIQLGGFLLLVLGTLLYNEVLKLPCSQYEEKKVIST